jgi:hypothetical protein
MIRGGEPVDPVKDAGHRQRRREQSSRPSQDHARLADNARREINGGI